MNSLSEQEMEALLRQPPRPRPPGELKQQLIARARSAPKTPSPQPSITTRVQHGWLRRWWPALAPASLALFCAVVMAVQQREIRELKETLQTLSAGATPAKTIAAPETRPGENAVEVSAADAQEIARLKDVVAGLTAEISQLEQMRLENQALRANLSSRSTQFSPQEMEGMEEMKKARERAMRIACVNNMKQLGLAARLWSQDNNDLFPTDVLQMTNEMNTPKILRCPADEARPAAATWSSFTSANGSYEYLAPGGTDAEPTRILFRCPIHSNLGLCDGSVQTVDANAASWVVQRDGKVYYEPPGK